MPVLLALHDVEGDETDLPPVLRMIAPGWTVLSPRLSGNAQELVQWIQANAAERPYALGYGTGADLGATLLLHHPGVIAGAILLRPTEATVQPSAAPIEGRPVLV